MKSPEIFSFIAPGKMTVTKLKHILRDCQHLCAIKILLNLNVDKEMLLGKQHDASAFFSPSPWLGLDMTQAKKLVFRIQLSPSHPNSEV